jgi:hypothetical protein
LGLVVEPVDDLVAPLEHVLRVELLGHRLARAGHALDLVQQLGRAQQRLGRHARPVSALATDQLALDQGHVQSLGAELSGAHFAGRPGPDHDHVVLAHSSSQP